MKRFTIQTRLMLILLFSTVLPVGGLGLFYQSTVEHTLTNLVKQRMASIADKKTEQIDNFINLRFDDLVNYSRNPSVINSLMQLSSAFAKGGMPAINQINEQFQHELNSLLESGHYYDLLLIDQFGNVVFSSRQESDYGANIYSEFLHYSTLTKGVLIAMDSLNATLSHFEPYPASGNKIASFFIAPILRDNKLIGSIALQVNMEDLNRVLSDVTGLGITGETVLAEKQGQDILFMSSLKHIEDAAFKFRLPIEKNTLPIAMAINGIRQEVISNDYDGHQVVAATRYLPSLSWGLVIKVETKEALASAYQLKQLIWWSLGVILFICIGATALLARSITQPINQLIATASITAFGEKLLYVNEVGGPELRSLAQSFNKMIERLFKANKNLEATVTKRTQELSELSTLQGAILENAAYGIIATRPNGLITVFNRSAELMLGYQAKKVINRYDPTLFFLPEQLAERAEKFAIELGHELKADFSALVIRSKIKLQNEYEWMLVRQDGSQFTALLSISALTDNKEQITGYLIIASDITKRKKAESLLLKSSQQLNEAQRIAKLGSWSLDLTNNQLEWSDEIFRLFEINPTEFEASYEAFLNAIHPDDRTLVDKAYKDSLLNRKPYQIKHRLLFPDGRIKYVNEVCETIYNDQGLPSMSHGTVQDITSQKLAEDTIILYANVFRHSVEAIMITDHRNRIVAVNNALTKLSGYNSEELIGKDPKILASGQTPIETYIELWHSVMSTGYWQGELTDKRKNGEIYHKWISITAIRDNNHKFINFIATFSDITERKESEQHIFRLAHHDALTGLYNRFSLSDKLEQAVAMAHREQQQLAVMFIDMDRFKIINDTLGHHIGDRLLVEVARRLQSSVRDCDIVARFGGDEFVVVVINTKNTVMVANIAAKIVKTLSASYNIAEQDILSSPSIGISLYPQDGEDNDTLMKNADIAMYHAKEQGRNNYQFYTEEFNTSSQERLQLEASLRLALDLNQLELYYQPKIETVSGLVCGVEALIRWNHPDLGLLGPDRFIPIAEESGLIGPLGAWVIDQACHQLMLWEKQGLYITMAINLSPKQLRNSEMVAQLLATIEKYNVAKGRMEMEITETAAMSNAEQAIEQMKVIRNAGVDLSIDDFGTGHSSLAYLKLFPIKTLKLDRTFVRDLEHDESDAVICLASISLAHSLGLRVVAEGVETEGQKEFLKLHQCDVLQGYLFSKPLPSVQVTEYIKNNYKL